jgi:hypothetical protein
MAVILERVDSVPLAGNDLTIELNQWLTTLVDSLNTSFQTIEDNLIAPSRTTAEITALSTDAPNGSFWYDTDTNQIKAKSNGIVVVVV